MMEKLKELITKYSGKEKKDFETVSFRIDNLYNSYLDDIANRNEISKSFLLRIISYEFVDAWLDSVKIMNDIRCPECGKQNVNQINIGQDEAKGHSIYKCPDGHIFVFKSLPKYKKLTDFVGEKK